MQHWKYENQTKILHNMWKQHIQRQCCSEHRPQSVQLCIFWLTMYYYCLAAGLNTDSPNWIMGGGTLQQGWGRRKGEEGEWRNVNNNTEKYYDKMKNPMEKSEQLIQTSISIIIIKLCLMKRLQVPLIPSHQELTGPALLLQGLKASNSN